MSQDKIEGWVTRLQSGFITVQTGGGRITCHVRGRLKRTTFRGDILAVGDRVKVSLQPDGSGMVEEIELRRNALVRMDPTPKGEYQQVLLANPDQVVLVFACANPPPHLRMLDRFLVICEKQQIPAAIVINKIDLIGLEQACEMFAAYPKIGYPVLFTSVKQAYGLEAFKERLLGRLTGLAGPSGVGKSSLLNAIQPELGLAVREVSEQTSKGKHVTVVREMFPLNEGGFVVDLPGLKSLALWDTQPEELDGYFPELRSLVAACLFSDCTHLSEPGCAVKKAVEEGTVSLERYNSYLRMRFGEDS